ncbi:MAG: glycosyltransferase family 4 protein [Planctomycetes bacterium]|nr:glycosyltransferase family 4 protein [Planctomycetota bacterium]
MLRICWNWLVHDAPPSGANRRRLELLKAALLPEYSPKLELIVLLLREGIPAPVADSRVVIERVNAQPGAAMRVLYESRLLNNIVKKHRCDAILQESFPVPSLRSAPIALTVHDLRDLDPATRGARSIRSFFAPSVIHAGLRRATAVIAVSEFTKQSIILHDGPNSNITVIPNAADHLIIPFELPARDSATILFVGHLENRKGADIAIEAFGIVGGARAGAKFIFCGTGPLEGKIERRAAELNITDRVRFLSSVDDNDLTRLYLTSTVVVIPSRYEGFGIPLLEALRMGTPVLAARSSALPEVAGGHGVFVESFEPKDWAAAIHKLLDPTHRKHSSAHAAPRSGDFSWRASAGMLIETLEKISK